MEVWKGILWTGLGLALVAVILFLLRRSLLKDLKSNNRFGINNLENYLGQLEEIYPGAKLIFNGLRKNCDVGLWKDQEALFLKVDLNAVGKEFLTIKQSEGKSYSEQKLLKKKIGLLEEKLAAYSDILHGIEELPRRIIEAKNETYDRIRETKKIIGKIDSMVIDLNGILIKLQAKIDENKKEFEREEANLEDAGEGSNWFARRKTFSNLCQRMGNIKNEVECLHQKREKSVLILTGWLDRIEGLNSKKAVGGKNFVDLTNRALDCYDQASLILGNYPDYKSIRTDWSVVGKLLIEADDCYGQAEAIYERNKLWMS